MDAAFFAELAAYLREERPDGCRTAECFVVLRGPAAGQPLSRGRAAANLPEPPASFRGDAGSAAPAAAYLREPLEVSGVASDASFRCLREHALPAAQRAGLRRAGRRGVPGGVRDLGCHRLVASGAGIFHLIWLRRVPVSGI